MKKIEAKTKKRIVISTYKADKIMNGLNHIKVPRNKFFENISENDDIIFAANLPNGSSHPIVCNHYMVTQITDDKLYNIISFQIKKLY